LRLEPWRVVESQHQVSTRKLVDSDVEQHLLEQLIDNVKPPAPAGNRLHYLLFTPFRYPPLPHGSRFGTRTERGIWYGSETLRAAFAEVAYYRFLFIEGTTADLGLLQVELSAFRAQVRTARGIDLTVKPFSAYEPTLASRTSYTATQELGRDMRNAQVEMFRYRSARDTERGVNIAVFSPAVFGRRLPRAFEVWHCVNTRARVELTRRDYFQRAVFAFERAEFLVDGVLPAPAI
jgi:hypothetical protein